MGACMDCRIYKMDDVKKAKEQFVADQESDRYENGHSYSGTIGMCAGVGGTVGEVEARRDAYDWIDENAEKWECARVVKFKEKGKSYIMIGGICSS